MDDPACETPETRPGRTWKRATKYAQVGSEVASSPLLHCTALHCTEPHRTELNLNLEPELNLS